MPHTARMRDRVICACIGALLTLAVGAGARAADPASVEAGARALREHSWGEAEEHLQRALEDWPDDPDLQVLLGIALYHEGHPRRSADLMRRALAHGTRYAPRAWYYLGVIQAGQGRREDAERTFALLVSTYPDSPEAAKTRTAAALTLETRDPTRPGERMAEIIALALIGYDDHPQEVSERAGLFSTDPDVFVVGHLTLGWRFEPVRVRASISHLDYLKDDRLDADALRLQLDHAFYTAGGDSLVPRYAIRLLWLDHAFYEVRHDLSLRWNRRWDEAIETDLTPYVRLKNHRHPYQGEDGWVGGIEGVITRHLTTWRWLPRVHVGVDADRFQARDEWLGWSEATVFAGCHGDMAWRLSADLDLSWRTRSYGATDPAYGERRADNRVEAEVTVSKPLAEWLVVQLGIEHDVNRSNIGDYDFSRNVVSLGLIAAY